MPAGVTTANFHDFLLNHLQEAGYLLEVPPGGPEKENFSGRLSLTPGSAIP